MLVPAMVAPLIADRGHRCGSSNTQQIGLWVRPAVPAAVSVMRAQLLVAAEMLDNRHVGTGRWQAPNVTQLLVTKHTTGARRRILAPFATQALDTMQAIDTVQQLVITRRWTPYSN
jgi:hypothetical protein